MNYLKSGVFVALIGLSFTACGGEVGIGDKGDSDAIADPVAAEPTETLLEQFLEWLGTDNE